MEILKRGEVRAKTHDTICGNCNSHLRVGKCDGKYVSDQRDGDYIDTNCPVCGNRLTISVSLFR